jgi:hypothetical protein
VCAGFDTVPSPHSLHDDAPDPLIVSPRHGKHAVAPPALNVPAGHVATLSLFSAQNDPAGHTNSRSHTKPIVTARRASLPALT